LQDRSEKVKNQIRNLNEKSAKNICDVTMLMQLPMRVECHEQLFSILN